MKKFLLAFAVVPFLIAGCGSGNSDNNATTDNATTGSTTTAGTDQAATTTTGGDSTASTNATAGDPKAQLVGTWKVSMDKSHMPPMSEADKAEGESVRVTVNADGTYTSKTSKEEGKGTWTIEGHEVHFKSDKQDTPPVMTLSEDGTELTATVPSDKETFSLVMVKE